MRAERPKKNVVKKQVPFLPMKELKKKEIKNE